jgi:type IV pilus assembly protein PilC
MPIFLYRARDWKGTEKEGIVSGSEPQEAARELQEQGLFIVSLREYRGWHKFQDQAPVRPYDSKQGSSFLSRPLKFYLGKARPGTRDFMVFCRQFAALTGAGITLFNSLRLLEEQTEHNVLREKIKDVASRVERGHSLAESFRVNSDVFPSLLINMIEAGEAGGVFDAVLERLALHFEKQYDLEQKIRSATFYPKFIACAAMAAVIFMVVAVLPAFTGIFENMGMEMPALTRLLIFAGNMILSYWHILFIIFIAAVFYCKRLLKTNQGRRFYDRLRLNSPVFGPINRKIVTARFCRTLSTLLGSGTAMLPSLDLVKEIMDNSICGENIARTKEGIVRGQPLARALAAGSFFPPLVVEMVSVGEQTGNLEGMLTSAAGFLEAEVSYIIDRLSSLLEPLLILFMAGIIALIALSVLLPMFEVYQMI